MYGGERFNSVTHLLGVLLAVPGAAVLLERAIATGHARTIVGVIVFGLSMIALYLASTLYHSLRGPAKELWAKVDQCAIYFFIAGSYTPFALITLHGAQGWALLSAVWAMALAGLGKELWWQRGRVPSVAVYLCMGWVGVFAAAPLTGQLAAQTLLGLMVGGLLYSVGVVFYLLGKRWRHAHGVWHIFVLGGTASHFVTVLKLSAA